MTLNQKHASLTSLADAQRHLIAATATLSMQDEVDVVNEVEALVALSSVAAVVDVLVRNYHPELMRVLDQVRSCKVCRGKFIPADEDEVASYCSEYHLQLAAWSCPGCGRDGGGCACP